VNPPIVSSKARHRWLLAAEIVLVLVILGLLLAIWMPALVGARPGTAL
jgi:hypothetical protein